MKPRVLFLFVIGMLMLAAGAVAGEQGGLKLKERETIVFAGDSITAAGLYVDYIEGYLLTRHPERDYRIIDSGRSSENLSGLCEADHPNNRRPCLFERFTPAVTEFAPTLVVACYGMNDGIYHPFSPERFEKYQAGVRRLIGLVQKETGARLLLLTPPVYDSKNPGQPDARPEASYGYKKPFADYDQVLARYAGWLKEQRVEGVVVADLHARMQDYLARMRQGEPGFIMSHDGIHPGPDGHLVMAMAVLKAWGEPARVDAKEIDAAKGDALAFTWKSKIPMPGDAKWTSRTLAVTGFIKELNEYRLRAKGLKPGRYALLADGVEAGRFTAAELGEGVDLTALEQFPTTARSRQILPLLTARRKLGYEVYRKGAEAKSDAKRAELDQKIRELCQPLEMKIELRKVE